MIVDRTAVRVGGAIGGTGVVVNAVTHTTIVVFQFPFLFEEGAVPYFGTWFGAIARIGASFTFGMVLVAAVAAFVVAFAEDRDAGPVIAGFVLGGLVFGLGLATTNWILSQPLARLLGFHLRLGVWMALIFTGTASVGALGGDVVGPLFRSPDESTHPRW